MIDPFSNTASITERVRPVAIETGVVAVHFLGDIAAFVLAEEAIVLASPDGETKRIAVHDGAILSSASDGKRIVTGGDDGKIVSLGSNNAPSSVASDPKRRWIDRVALGPDGAVAWSAGKTASVKPGKGVDRTWEGPSTVGGLAFAPKGFRLAVAHYNGVSLWFPNASAAPEMFEWKGSHLDVAFSPDGKYLITAMQEPMLHGWRLADGKHMRMSGYAARVRSIDWTAGGRQLASSGSDKLILWPFHGKDGPMGRSPGMFAAYKSRVVQVACHPKSDVVAVGYEDGLALLVRIEDGAEIVVRRPGDSPISALAWGAHGSKLAFGTEGGEAGIVDL
ncbi:MAG TPA: WD40 repeat domain-containing protein [Xanthobacteraceae bacterium]|nr:WD40 repeat domain-containing protein [Xanthobacteraceae bacterium]